MPDADPPEEHKSEVIPPPVQPPSWLNRIARDARLQHPLLVAASTALLGAAIAGVFVLGAARIQARSALDAAKLSQESKGREPRAASVSRDEDLHIVHWNTGYQDAYFLSDSAFQAADGYEVRMEACTMLRPSAFCIFTVKPTSTITITSTENATSAYRVYGEQAIACCLFFNGQKNGFHIVPGKATKKAMVGRITASPPDRVLLSIRIPEYEDGAPLDNIVFSIGGGDEGVRFPIEVKPLNGLPDATDVARHDDGEVKK